MPSASRRVLGFTLIELMVTVAVFTVLAMLALPSFNAFRQRSALRGTSEQVVGFWNQARFESAKRNQMVKVGVSSDSTGYCLGAATTTNAADTTPCDCHTAGACNVAVYPGDPTDQTEWRGVTLNGTPTLGSNNAVAVIEPKRGSLATASQAGAISFTGPTGPKSYHMNLLIDQFGKTTLCQSTGDSDRMSDYLTRRCAP